MNIQGDNRRVGGSWERWSLWSHMTVPTISNKIKAIASLSLRFFNVNVGIT